MIIAYWEGNSRAYHHTAPINMLYALHQALSLVLNEGKEAVYNRHQKVHQHLVAGLEEMGLKMLVDAPHRLPMLNSVVIPQGISDEAAIRKHLLNNHQIEIGGGLGILSGKIWRIGTMGYTAKIENVDRLLKVLRETLSKVL
jgi:alanine-glyoxylate transaminase/serine-glyoxylate transaminase/serine-pyruvate transaminase